MVQNNRYGIELILDLHGCNTRTFTREKLSRFFVELCQLIDMKRHGDPMFWHDDSSIAHLKGISAVQFIETSNIVIHCLEILEAVYLNIFSCKEFDVKKAERFSIDFFGAQEQRSMVIDRHLSKTLSSTFIA